MLALLFGAGARGQKHGSQQHAQPTLTDTQHDHYEIIISTLHVYLDHHNCSEMLALRGPRLVMPRIHRVRRCRPSNCLRTGGHFHSHNCERALPWASTSCSKTAATLFRRDHLEEELW